MSYVPEMRQLNGLSFERASMYGMPHIGAHYYADNVDCTEWDDRTRRECACCGRVSRNMSKHHEPPKSNARTFLLRTKMGQFVLKPALIALCGSGVSGCHGDRHHGRLAIRWEWDSDEDAESWWDGTLLSHGYGSNDKRLFGHGCYVFDRNGMKWKVRL